MSDVEPIKLGDDDASATDSSDRGGDLSGSVVPAEGPDSVVTATPSNSGYVSEDTTTSGDVRSNDLHALGHLGEPEERDLSFTYLSHLDPDRQKSPHGVYLDDVDRAKAEVVRAQQEGREPDLDNPPAVASTPVVPTVVAQSYAQPGVQAPVDFTAPVSVGVPEDQIPYNAEAARQNNVNPDGSAIENEDDE
jgi:hypothetical protein